MQGGSQENNVVSIFSRKNVEEHQETKTAASDEGLSFAEVMRRNNENAERLRKEREKANRNVIRSYRLKPR